MNNIELVIDNRNGSLWNITEIVSDISWKTSRSGKAGSLTFTMVKSSIYQDPTFKYGPGDVVRLRRNEQDLFMGYIFIVDHDKNESVKITAYDQIRYLMASDTYVFKNVTATQVLQKIAGDFGLKLGTVADTKYVIPKMMEDSQKLLDIILKAINLTLIATGKMFVLMDNFGLLELRDNTSMELNLVIGDESLMTDYKFKRSIDSDTYNQVKIVQDNKKTGKREVYITKDSANIAKWGLLQLYQKAEEGMNVAQINEALNNLIEMKNREQRTLRIDAIGDIRVRAGSILRLQINELGMNEPVFVEECNHNFEGDEHTMSLELKVYG